MTGENQMEMAGQMITVNSIPTRKKAERNKQDIKVENIWWQLNMLEASLICARMGLIENAISLKKEADFWAKA